MPPSQTVLNQNPHWQHYSNKPKKTKVPAQSHCYLPLAYSLECTGSFFQPSEKMNSVQSDPFYFIILKQPKSKREKKGFFFK